MFDLKKEWSISFAGCGFMGIYYVGVASCILERFPRFVQDASKISGASAGALMATVLSVGIPLEKCCADLMFMTKEARKHKLGPLHPSCNLLRIVKDSLLGSLPEDAHIRASGKLCVSLTRVCDGKNLLVSQFDSREELVEHYVDGAITDNLPRCHLRNTVTISAYAGESDLCPRASTLSFHEVRFNNVSIQVNSENMYRVTSTFFPPEAETMAEICHNGYADGLRFLQENNLISSECPMRSLELDAPTPACCDLLKAEDEKSSENTQQKGPQEEHWWLDLQLIQNLPVDIRKALCEACRETHTAGGLLSHVTQYLPKKVTSYLQIPRVLPVETARSLTQRLVDWIPDVPKDINWLYGMAGGIYKQAWKDKEEDSDREAPVRRSTSLPSGLDLWDQEDEDSNTLPMTPEATPTSSLTFTWNTNSEVHHMSLTPPPTPTFSPASGFGEAAAESPKSVGRDWGLGRAVGWIRNVSSEQTSNLKKTDDSLSCPAFQ
uniref:patatin-like phospholipase domain-containing protein 2 isoform X2 n=1 Tax=Scatophagus argus TaxID=75038 RepID=UPI001ED831B0|nr:patatin-like phospholipase domain-containing protein 2 isoform X2 [Scatophagus argus]